MTVEDLIRESLEYDPETGDLFWKVARGSGGKGRKAGNKKSGEHIKIRLCGKDYLAHRLAWLLYYGTWPNKHLDHKDGDGSNNRISNLREASHAENMRNRPKKGYSWHKNRKKFQAYISINHRQIYLGYFDTEEEARKAHEEVMEKYHGEFANYNVRKGSGVI